MKSIRNLRMKKTDEVINFGIWLLVETTVTSSQVLSVLEFYSDIARHSTYVPFFISCQGVLVDCFLWSFDVVMHECYCISIRKLGLLSSIEVERFFLKDSFLFDLGILNSTGSHLQLSIQ